MRKALIGLLIAATATMPVASAAAQNWDRGGRRAERHEQRSERHQARSERRQRAERPQRQRAAQPQARFSAQERRGRVAQRPAVQQRSWQGSAQRSARRDRTPDTTYVPARQRYSQARQDSRRGSNWSGSNRQWDGRRDGSYSGDRRWDGRRDGNWNRSGNWNNRRHSWNRSWRNDRRYDWSGYRNRNRHIYHVGRYYSPYRHHRYSRFSIGFFLEPLFFGSRYWISDPWHYRLPPAYPGTRWIRYYDDVLLVDMYSGEVLDVIHNFFW
jgi:hypothetical protein